MENFGIRQIMGFTNLKMDDVSKALRGLRDVTSIDKLKDSLNFTETSEVVALAIFFLQDFVRANFIGPATTASTLQNFPELPNDPILNELSLDGIQRCKHAKNGLGLAVAKWTFFDKRNNGSLRESCAYFDWWTLRTVFAWQSVLQEPSEKLKQISEEAVSNFAGSEFFSAMDKSLQTLFWLEAGMNFLQFFDHTKAEQAVQKALEISGLNFSLVGALGKRTKFQQRSVAQLKLTVTGTGEGVAEECEFIPKNCALQDNTVLDTVEFEEKNKEEDLTKISSLEQAVILAMAKLRWRMEPKMGGLLQEEIKVYVDKILESPRDPLVQISALFLRCELEKSERRRVERALAQTEQLSKEFQSNSEHKGSVYVFAVAQVPIWKVKKLQADLLISLAVVSEALGIYESLECWEHVIDCYKTLGKLDHAEHIIRDRLNEKEEPEFLCLLGDITSNPTHYQRAWEVSGKRSSRAMASLGRLYIHKNRMEDAFYCLKSSVDIQPIQLKTWFNLGYCAMELKRYDAAAQAFHRCVNIEPDNFEAWNNLAASYIHNKKLDKAFYTLQETIRYNYESWKVWDNYMGVSVETGHFKEAIRSYHRLLDLRSKHIDVNVLTVLVKAALSDNDKAFYQDLRTLFGRLTSIVTGDANIWRLYAELIEPADVGSQDEWDKYVNILKRAHQSGFQNDNWMQNEDMCVGVMETVDRLAHAQLKLAAVCSSEEQSVQIKSSLRLTVKGVLVRVVKYYQCQCGMSVESIGNKKIRDLYSKLQLVSGNLD